MARRRDTEYWQIIVGHFSVIVKYHGITKPSGRLTYRCQNHDFHVVVAENGLLAKRRDVVNNSVVNACIGMGFSATQVHTTAPKRTRKQKVNSDQLGLFGDAND